MMNEKKKYIDIDSVVGNLDEVTVKDLRKQAGMSRKDFCNSFEIPYRTLQSWELGEREMSDFSKRLLAYVIKTSELVENYKRDLEKQVEGEQDGEKKEYRIRFGRGWNSKIGIYSSRRIPTAESVTGKGGWIYRKMGNHEKRVPTKTQTSCLFFDAFDG